jgi:plastocyanin
MDSTSQATGGQVRRNRLGQMPRRDALRLFGALGLSATGVGAIGIGAISTRASATRSVIGVTGHGVHGGWNLALLRQDAGTPAPASTPQLGEQPDGSHIWKVQVAGMDMENLIDTQAFFPKEITINAGDAIYFEFPTPPGFHTVTFLSGEEAPPADHPRRGGRSAGQPPGRATEADHQPRSGIPLGSGHL